MKSLVICILLFLNIILCLPTSDNVKSDARIISKTNEFTSDNGYKFSYKLSDGSGRDEKFIIKNKGTKQEEHIVIGSYYYTELDKIYRVYYVADKNGYKANITVELEEEFPSLEISPNVLKTLVG